MTCIVPGTTLSYHFPVCVDLGDNNVSPNASWRIPDRLLVDRQHGAAVEGIWHNKLAHIEGTIISKVVSALTGISDFFIIQAKKQYVEYVRQERNM